MAVKWLLPVIIVMLSGAISKLVYHLSQLWVLRNVSFCVGPVRDKSLTSKVPSIEQVYTRLWWLPSKRIFWMDPPGPMPSYNQDLTRNLVNRQNVLHPSLKKVVKYLGVIQNYHNFNHINLISITYIYRAYPMLCAISILIPHWKAVLHFLMP